MCGERSLFDACDGGYDNATAIDVALVVLKYNDGAATSLRVIALTAQVCVKDVAPSGLETPIRSSLAQYFLPSGHQFGLRSLRPKEPPARRVAPIPSAYARLRQK